MAFATFISLVLGGSRLSVRCDAMADDRCALPSSAGAEAG